LKRALRMRSRYDKRTTRPFILPTVGERERGKTEGEGEGPKKGPRDKI
jgi:hypothetical protein